jgi:hypothetical protein
MNKLFALALLAIGVQVIAVAAVTVSSPEIDATSSLSAIALVTGAVVAIRGRRK